MKCVAFKVKISNFTDRKEFCSRHLRIFCSNLPQSLVGSRHSIKYMDYSESFSHGSVCEFYSHDGTGESFALTRHHQDVAPFSGQ